MKKVHTFAFVMNKYLYLAFFFMIASINVADAQSSIAFRVSFSEPQAHYADVEMTLTGNNDTHTDVRMPVWAPGSYLVREFAKNVESFNAETTQGTSVSFAKTNKNTWRIENPRKADLRIRYRVYAFEISVRTSFIDASHAFLSPTGIFMYPEGRINMPSTVSVDIPAAWSRISTGLEVVKGKKNTFRAANFDVLFDSPIEVGNQDVFEFNAAGVHHEVAMVNGGNYDKERLKKDMADIIERETAIYGENPNKNYVFIVHNYQRGGGGLEHLNSTVLGASRFSYSTEKGYNSFLSLVAHEYFHLWNVKRLRPKALGPFDYSNENYTSELWIAEGFTAYYDNLLLRRTGAYKPEQYLDVIAADMNSLENQPGNKLQPVTGSSFDAWIKYYRPNENSNNTGISYYTKGSILGFILDLEIINATQGRKGLDDVMKAMYDEYYKKQHRGYTTQEFKATAEKIAGISLDNFYRDYVDGTAPIQYNVHFGHAGLSVIDDNAGKNIVSAGFTISATSPKFTVSAVKRGSAEWEAGLNVNDEIIAADNYRVTTQSEYDNLLNFKRPGDTLKLLVSRDGIIKEITLNLKKSTSSKLRIVIDENATAAQLAVRKKWLSM